MLAEISAGYSSLKTALDIAKGLNATNTQVQINEAKITLQSLILEAQASLSAANEAQVTSATRIRALEEEIARMKAWDTEAERYELKNVYLGAVAYVLKPETQGSEAPHWLCANCFTNKRKSFLQEYSPAPLGNKMLYKCAVCGGIISVHYVTSPTNPWNPQLVA